MRRAFLVGALSVIAIHIAGAVFLPETLWILLLTGPLLILGFRDFFQTKQTIKRNFPLVGNFRYLFEAIRPEINQYFVESNTDGVPFSREQRSLVYQRAKHSLDTLPFGTQKNVYEPGYEWINHSLVPTHISSDSLRILIGGKDTKHPYNASLLNISAMSYGSLSKNAVLALNGGAADGNFAHNTGEGGISPYHLKHQGDLIWQIGTGYFGCRTDDGKFSPEGFRDNASRPSVKMIEIKLSQGAKPGHGGILPAAKVTKEISEIRHVPMGVDVISPPSHSAFSNPIELLEFVAQLRELSGGKPVGFKLCIGKRREFISICKAMIKTGIIPDYISIDGGEGGTGAAPIEFSNHLGSPTVEGLIFAHNALIGFGVRDKLRLLASGKIVSGFGVVKLLALGADATYSARAMMLALGCIQALRCNSNHCPAGVATQNAQLNAGLVVSNKRIRVAQFHKETIESVAHLLGAMGLDSPEEIRAWHIMRRISPCETRHYGELYEYLSPGDLLKDDLPKSYARAVQAAAAESFKHNSV